jgi:hypothetical protein
MAAISVIKDEQVWRVLRQFVDGRFAVRQGGYSIVAERKRPRDSVMQFLLIAKNSDREHGVSQGSRETTL